MTARKRWPNTAEWARQDALAEARKGQRELSALLENEHMDQVEAIRRVAIAIIAFNNIEKILHQAGTEG